MRLNVLLGILLWLVTVLALLQVMPEPCGCKKACCKAVKCTR